MSAGVTDVYRLRVLARMWRTLNAFLLEGGPCDLWLSFSPLSCTSELLFPTFPLLFHPTHSIENWKFPFTLALQDSPSK